MKIRKHLSLIFIIIILIVAAYFSLQFYYLKFVYNVDVHVDVRHLTDFGETIIITASPTEDYLEYENIRIGNFFEDFDARYIGDNVNRIYVNEASSANFWFGVSEYLPINLRESFILLAEEFETNVDHRMILERYNINNDLELINLVVNAEKSNIFTPIRQMRERYILHTFAEIVLSQIQNIALVEGSYNGVMNTISYGKELNIFKNDRVYFFTFLNLEYFNNNKIQEIINTIIINGR